MCNERPHFELVHTDPNLNIDFPILHGRGEAKRVAEETRKLIDGGADHSFFKGEDFFTQCEAHPSQPVEVGGGVLEACVFMRAAALELMGHTVRVNNPLSFSINRDTLAPEEPTHSYS